MTALTTNIRSFQQLKLKVVKVRARDALQVEDRDQQLEALRSPRGKTPFEWGFRAPEGPRERRI